MSKQPINFHSWLRRSPPISKLRLDGKRVVIVGTGKQKWRDAVNTVEAFKPGMVEGLDDDDNVIRVTTELGSDEDDEAKQAEKFASQSRDVQLASVIMEAGDRGALRVAETYGAVFQQQSAIVQMICDRLTSLEAAWQTTLERRAEELENAKPGDGDDPAGAVVRDLIRMKVAGPQPSNTTEKKAKAK